MQATTVRSAFAVAFSRLNGWWNNGLRTATYPTDMKFTDSLERELCERETRRLGNS